MDSFALPNGGHLYRFETGPFNWYVIRQDGRVTVVDAGFPGHYAVLRRGLRQIGAELRDVTAILLTHAHADHMGFAERLRRDSGAPVFVHAADAAAAQRTLRLPWAGLLGNAWRPYVASMLSHATANGVFLMPPIRQVRTFDDNQVLDVPGRPTVLHLPGHTPGEVAFLLDGGSVLLSGDTLVTRHLLTGRYGAPQVPPPSLSHDYAQAHRSLARFRELGTLTMLPGHGKPWHGDLSACVAADAQPALA